MGFEGEVYKNMARPCERVQEAKEVRDVVSLVTIRKAFRDWVVGRYANTTSDFMTRYVLGRCGSDVAETEILIPIAATMIEGEIQLGRVTLKTFSRDMFESWKAAFQ